MFFSVLTLLTALSLASVSGLFSIFGFMSIYAGMPIYALIMGIVTEGAKLVTTSWIYRNWEYCDWKLKIPLLYFTAALMIATSIGVFGFLSKAHLQQGSETIDNSAKIEQLINQIQREKAVILDDEKLIAQLDATVNSFLGKDRTDRSLSVRKSQAPQRKQLRDDIDSAQKRIDAINKEKFQLESEIRKIQLDVGPIRYIAELFYGSESDTNKNIELAVRMFTLLLVSTLDPLAVVLLIAANHTLIRLRKEKIVDESGLSPISSRPNNESKIDKATIQELYDEPASIRNQVPEFFDKIKETKVYVPLSEENISINEKKEEDLNNRDETEDTISGIEESTIFQNESYDLDKSASSEIENRLGMVIPDLYNSEILLPIPQEISQVVNEEDKIFELEEERSLAPQSANPTYSTTPPTMGIINLPIIRPPKITQIIDMFDEESSILELPEIKVNTEVLDGSDVAEQGNELNKQVLSRKRRLAASSTTVNKLIRAHRSGKKLNNDKYPETLSWLSEFKRLKNE